MADMYEEGYDAGYKKAKTKYREVLIDVMVMFENIEKNRQLPAYGNAIGQYVAMGNVVRKLLEEE